MHRHTDHASGIMVWGGIGFHCRTPLVQITGTPNIQRNISKVLKAVVLPYIQSLPSAIFHQDNARPHVHAMFQAFFFIHQIELLPWLACSPDLSPILNVWSMFEQRLVRDTQTAATTVINFANIWKSHALLYPKDTSKASLILCRDVGQWL
ncbi:transposable element Tc3 transposase [Trichonephila clavipes]|nr:transposable element Tc3 transposase [Trichonephila clavipes]